MAGWRSEKIAVEMRITVEKVEEILRNHKEKPTKERECVKKGETQLEKVMSLTATELREIYERAAAIGAKEAIKIFEQERKRSTARGQISGFAILNSSCGITTC